MKALLNCEGYDRFLGFVIRPERVVLTTGESGMIWGIAIDGDACFGVAFLGRIVCELASFGVASFGVAFFGVAFLALPRRRGSSLSI